MTDVEIIIDDVQEPEEELGELKENNLEENKKFAMHLEDSLALGVKGESTPHQRLGVEGESTPLLIQLRAKDIPEYRQKLIEEQNGLCAICKDVLNLESKTSGVSLDHQHKTQSEEIGVKGAGLIRGVLCRDCNTFEGKIWNNSKRFNKFPILPDFLRAVADYLEKPNYPWIHPSEAPKPKKVSKRQYNKLCKVYGESKLTAKIPPFPPGKRGISKKLQGLFDRFEISPYIGE